MFSRFLGAVFRAVMVIVLISIPSYLLSQTVDSALLTSFASVCCGVLVFAEYNARAPSLVEFRDAGPVNRIRYMTALSVVFILAMSQRNSIDATTLSQLSHFITLKVGALADFPYSPVRLFQLALSADSSDAARQVVTQMAGLAYVVSIIGIIVMAIVLYLSGWPTNGRSFNLWVNLPTFEPVANGDSMDRLSRDATMSMVAGFLMPFAMPAVAHLLGALDGPVDAMSPSAAVWLVSIWAFLPASLFMRGIAIVFVVRSIAAQRQSVAANVNEYSAV